MFDLPDSRHFLIGMVHLGPLPGQGGSPGLAALTAGALADARALEEAGFDAVLVENWRDESPGPFVSPQDGEAIEAIAGAVARAVGVPVGLNVLPNDYRTAFAVADRLGLAFVQLDVLVDPVRTDYSVSRAAPFEVRVDPEEVCALRPAGVGLLASVQPKHYRLLAPRPLEDSVRAARRFVDAVVVTGPATGAPPDVGRLRRAVEAAAETPVLVGSGLDPANAALLLAESAGAIVGTAVKTPDFARVDPERARALVLAVRTSGTRPGGAPLEPEAPAC
ncbi:MAG: phosphorybosylanthranilate isomerase [Planctomycetota bacterium]|nr:MAG: phosphorybosylanthranilate isomerase [Planctomycetota bacterium]